MLNRVPFFRKVNLYKNEEPKFKNTIIFFILNFIKFSENVTSFQRKQRFYKNEFYIQIGRAEKGEGIVFLGHDRGGWIDGGGTFVTATMELIFDDALVISAEGTKDVVPSIAVIALNPVDGGLDTGMLARVIRAAFPFIVG